MPTNLRRVCMLGAFAADYPRHQIIIAGLERVGVEVKCILLPRNLNTAALMLQMIRHWHETTDCDVVIIPAFNQLLGPAAWLLGQLSRKPVLIDYMVGLTDSIVEERGEASSVQATIYRLIDRFNTARMTSVTDTAAHRAEFHRVFGGALRKMSVLRVGVYDDWFSPQPPPAENDKLLVQFFGSYIPFHGVDVLLEAIYRFSNDPAVQFELIGRGQTYKESVARAEALKMENVSFVDMVPPPELPHRVAQATVCLGVFGPRAKTDYVIPNKVFQCMALGRPVITAESAALAECFVSGEHLVTVPPGDAEALALAIRKLVDSPSERQRIGAASAAKIQEAFLPQHIGARLKTIMEEM